MPCHDRPRPGKLRQRVDAFLQPRAHLLDLGTIILQPAALAPRIYYPDPLGPRPRLHNKEREGEGQGGEGGVRLGPTPR